MERLSFHEPVPLTELPVWRLYPEQLKHISLESINSKAVANFNPALAQKDLDGKDGAQVVAIDMGGDTLAARHFELRKGRLILLADLAIDVKADGGKGYLAGLEEASEFATQHGLSVGVSFAGPTEGTKPQAASNLSIFLSDISKKYDNDFATLLPNLRSFENDAVAGLVGGALLAKQTYKEVEEVVYLINGSGIGGAVLKDNKIYATEVGHVPLTPILNPYQQAKLCNIPGADFVCLERVAGNKAGIEDLWEQQTGEQLRGPQIEARYNEGNILARDLYDNSAHISAHAIRGLARVFNLPPDNYSSAIIGHGGAFKFPKYGARIQQFVNTDTTLKRQPLLLMTQDLSTNTCLDGAAYATILAEK